MFAEIFFAGKINLKLKIDKVFKCLGPT